MNEKLHDIVPVIIKNRGFCITAFETDNLPRTGMIMFATDTFVINSVNNDKLIEVIANNNINGIPAKCSINSAIKDANPDSWNAFAKENPAPINKTNLHGIFLLAYSQSIKNSPGFSFEGMTKSSKPKINEIVPSVMYLLS